MTGELFGAEEMEGWGVVNRSSTTRISRSAPAVFAAELAAGPTKAHAMTKHVLRRFREGGIPAADEAIRTEAADLFATEDLQQRGQDLPRARRPRSRHLRGSLNLPVRIMHRIRG